FLVSMNCCILKNQENKDWPKQQKMIFKCKKASGTILILDWCLKFFLFSKGKSNLKRLSIQLSFVDEKIPIV
ncbi:MAG: hypothetical protein K0S25_1830, partial [Bacillus sp. (in: firmicutes)]|nr:hypothetical protein [Bacillus sp. (in: firmicutes)]